MKAGKAVKKGPDKRTCGSASKQTLVRFVLFVFSVGETTDGGIF